MRRSPLLLLLLSLVAAAATEDPRLCGPGLDADQVELLARAATNLVVSRDIARRMLTSERFGPGLRELVEATQWVTSSEAAPFWQRLRELYRRARSRAVAAPTLRIAYEDLFEEALGALSSLPAFDLRRLVAPHLPLLRPAEVLLPRRRELTTDLLAEIYLDEVDEKALRSRLRALSYQLGVRLPPKERVADIARKLAVRDRKSVQERLDEIVAALGTDAIDANEFEAATVSQLATMPNGLFFRLPGVAEALARRLWDYEPIVPQDEEELRTAVLEGLQLQASPLVREHQESLPRPPPRHSQRSRRAFGANPVSGPVKKPGTRAERLAAYRPRERSPEVLVPGEKPAPSLDEKPAPGEAEAAPLALEERLATVALNETVLEEFLEVAQLLRPEERLTLDRALTRLQAGESLFSLYPLVRRVRRHRFWVIRLNGGTSNFRMVLQLTRQRVYGLLLADVKSNRNATERALDEAKRRWNGHLGR